MLNNILLSCKGLSMVTQKFYSKRGYEVTSKLDDLIEGKANKDKKKKSEIISELAWYCGVTKEQIYSIPSKTLSSIPVALLMARYFNCHVEDIFYININFDRGNKPE